jgi:hypothetical protein
LPQLPHLFFLRLWLAVSVLLYRTGFLRLPLSLALLNAPTLGGGVSLYLFGRPLVRRGLRRLRWWWRNL